MAYSTTAITSTSAVITNREPAPGLSSRYSLIPTDEILAALRGDGWQWSDGSARISRKGRHTAAHVIRMRHPNLPTVRDNVVEAVVLNSHDGSTAFRLQIGVFRFACANGLIVGGETAGSVRLVHSGLDLESVRAAADRMIQRAPEVVDTINRWSDIRVDLPTARQMARRCAIARWGDRLADLDVDRTIAVRRNADSEGDLWTTFNRIQESVLRGGMRVGLRPVGDITNDNVRQHRARALRGPIRQVTLNREMWEIAGEYASELSVAE